MSSGQSVGPLRAGARSRHGWDALMRYVRMGYTDLEVSVLGLGCGNFGGVGSAPELFGRGDDEAAAFALMDAAREHGITLFDTANTYGGGRSEQWIGPWLASPGTRGSGGLSTKGGNPGGAGAPARGGSAHPIPTPVEARPRRAGHRPVA